MIDKIYDMLALCASYIFNEISESPYEFALFEEEDYEGVFDAVETYSCDLQQKGRRKAFAELRDYIITFMLPKVTVEKCFAVVRAIDEIIEVEINDKLLGGKHIVKYSSMNEQYKDCVRIIPKNIETFVSRGNDRFKSTGDNIHSLLRKKRECVCSPLDQETEHYMIWDKEHIKNYPMWIYHFDEKHPLFKHFYEKEQIVFGIVPFTNKDLEELLDIKYQNKAFYIEQMYGEAEKELKVRYESICSRCEQEDIDFLIFPEMLMTEEILSSIKEKEKVLSPKIIINGSIWKDLMNKAVITDGNGNEIFSYYKKEPFKFQKGNKEYKEWLDQERNKEYFIMEIEGLGRIGVGICKDLISEEVKLFHKYVDTDILLVPAYTKSMDLQASAEELSQEYNCIVLVANACSALGTSEKGDFNRRIGFITIPAKQNTDRSKRIIRYTQEECVEECKCKCMGKKLWLISVLQRHTKKDSAMK